MYSLPELTRIATNYGIDVVFLSDSMVESIQYGVPWLRHVLWVNWNNRSVMRDGPETFLSLVARENARQANVLYVPGVEITPRYYWAGSLLTGNLTCHNHQRNIIALGIDDADVLREIPITAGYARGLHAFWRCITLLLMALFLGALFAAVFGAPVLARRSSFQTGELRRSFLTVMLLPLIAIMVVLNLIAGRNPDFDVYAADKPAKFEQRTLSYLEQQRIPCFWAHPEAFDRHDFGFGFLRLAIRTEPYPEILRQTTGYTGFAGINEGANNLIMPESLWDSVLMQGLRDPERKAAWCFGEMLYHYEGQAGKKMGNVQTMVWSEEREQAALLEAIRRGRFYARRNSDNQSLTLEEWRVCGACSGERVRACEDAVPVSLAVSASMPGARLSVQVLRNGKAIRNETLAAPFRLDFFDDLPGNEPVYYRALVFAEHPVKLATNPVFVDR